MNLTYVALFFGLLLLDSTVQELHPHNNFNEAVSSLEQELNQLQNKIQTINPPQTGDSRSEQSNLDAEFHLAHGNLMQEFSRLQNIVQTGNPPRSEDLRNWQRFQSRLQELTIEIQQILRTLQQRRNESF